MMNYFFSNLFLLLLFISCNNKVNSNTNDTYQIINILSKQSITTSKRIDLPPNIKIIDTIIPKLKQTIAVIPYFKHLNREISTVKCKGYKELYKKILETKGEEKELDISKIKQSEDNFISFHKEMITKGSKDFADMGFDLLFQFSDVVFNNDKTKAIVVFSSRTSTLAGSTVLFTLERQNNKWNIVCSQTLSIS